MKKFLAITGSALMGLTLTTGANAANPELVPVQVTFADAISISTTNGVEFGLLDSAMATGNTVTINPNSTTSDPQFRIVGGVQDAADLTVGAVATQTILIVVDNHLGATGYTLDTFVCNYNGGGDTACDGPGGYTQTSIASAQLLIGATLTANASVAAGVDDSTFDVTITYQ